MKRTVVAAAGVLALAGAAVFLVVVLVRGGDAGSVLEDVPEEREFVPGIQAQPNLLPRAVLFGDTVRAVVDVTLDPRRVVPESVTYTVKFDPWEPVGKPVTKRRDGEATTHLRTTWTLRCLSNACPPSSSGPARLLFTPVTLTFDRLKPEALSGQTMTRRWPALVVNTRLDAQSRAIPGFGSQRFETPWRAELVNLPDPTYRASADTIRFPLFGAAAALALAGLALAWLGRPRRRPVEVVEDFVEPPPPPPPAIEQALVLLETQAGTNGAPDRRRALELVASELFAGGEAELARQASRLAWSEDKPPREDARELAERARPALGLEGSDPEGSDLEGSDPEGVRPLDERERLEGSDPGGVRPLDEREPPGA